MASALAGVQANSKHTTGEQTGRPSKWQQASSLSNWRSIQRMGSITARASARKTISSRDLEIDILWEAGLDTECKTKKNYTVLKLLKDRIRVFL